MPNQARRKPRTAWSARAVAAAGLAMGAGFLSSACVTRQLRVASGMTSHNLCSAAFVSDLSPDRVYAESIRPIDGMGFVAPALSYRVDTVRREVRTRVLLGFDSRAVYEPGRGCTLVAEGGEPSPIQIARPKVDADPLNAPTSAVPMPDTELAAIVDRAFAEVEGQPARYTKAVVIVQDGRILAERYADGAGPQTRLLGWSMTKSIVATLVGALVQDGKLSVQTPAPIAEWRAPSDPRGSILVRHLLQMTSGLDVEENNSGADPVSTFLYTERDVARSFREAKLRAAPGTEWAYTSANTWALGRIVEDQVGGTPDALVAYANEHVFGPAGMTSVVMEFDAEGTPLGSSYALATARDWARLGLVYLRGGRGGDVQIVPQDWPAVVSAPAPGARKGYGAGFWTNLGDSPGAKQRVAWGMPADSYFALGYLGQYTVIVPSKNLVVVRMGDDHVTDQDGEAVARFVGSVVRYVDARGKGGKEARASSAMERRPGQRASGGP